MSVPKAQPCRLKLSNSKCETNRFKSSQAPYVSKLWGDEICPRHCLRGSHSAVEHLGLPPGSAGGNHDTGARTNQCLVCVGIWRLVQEKEPANDGRKTFFSYSFACIGRTLSTKERFPRPQLRSAPRTYQDSKARREHALHKQAISINIL